MKAITVKHPWAWAIAYGGKTVENRTALWTYRGPLAIHAGAAWSTRGEQSLEIRTAWGDGFHLNRDAISTDYYRAIVAVADLADVHPDTGCCRPWGESAYTETNGRLRRQVTHLVLEDVRRLRQPVACRGALGLWTVPDDIEADVIDQLDLFGGVA